jgi:hypothetical protein
MLQGVTDVQHEEPETELKPVDPAQHGAGLNPRFPGVTVSPGGEQQKGHVENGHNYEEEQRLPGVEAHHRVCGASPEDKGRGRQQVAEQSNPP